jgi:hypothetical protein
MPTKSSSGRTGAAAILRALSVTRAEALMGQALAGSAASLGAMSDDATAFSRGGVVNGFEAQSAISGADICLT